MAENSETPEIKKGINSYLTFAENAPIPDMRQDDITYRDNIRRQTGFAVGEPADNTLMNTVLRNVSLAINGLAEFLADNGVNVPINIESDLIKQGFETAINLYVVKAISNFVRPVLDNMQKQIDKYAEAYHGVPVGGIIPLSISQDDLAKFLKKYSCYAVCDGENGTIDLRERFILGASPTYQPGDKGGSKTFNNLEIEDHVITEKEMPKHSHEVPGSQSPFDVAEWPFGAPLGSNDYIGSPTAIKGYRVNSAPAGEGKGHSHNIVDRTLNERGIKEPQGMLPPYYALIFVQKILPY